MRPETEIDDVLNWTWKVEERGTVFPGLSYEEGVRAGIEWVTERSNDRPDNEP